MSRGKRARVRRRIKRAAASRSAALGVSKAQSQAVEAVRVTKVNGRIYRVRDKTDGKAAVKKALAAAGISLEANYDLSKGWIAERAFYAAQIEAGFTETRRASWPSEATLADHGEVLYRDEHGGLFRLDDGTLVLANIEQGWLYMRIAAPSREIATAAVDTFAVAYPPLYRDTTDGTFVPITFWTDSKWGPTSRLRMIESASWDDIAANYTADVKDELVRLMTNFEPGKDGQLLLWQGQPGTGKTWTLRALASEWKDWAEFSYITDPDAFFVTNPAYMVDVLLHDSYETLTVDGDVATDQREGKWRVLILEDTGELLSADAKDAYGQGLSRLLNVVDGMVGQGLRVLAIVTTNDELGELHPAVTRPGRCASQIVFGPFGRDEANAWLENHPSPDGNVAALGQGHEPVTLAELYALAGEATSAFADDVQDEGDAPDDDGDEPMSGKCASCGHMAIAHGGETSDGACSMKSCDCAGFEQAAARTASVERWVASGVTNGWLSTTPGANLAIASTAYTLNFEPYQAVDGLPAEHQPGSQLPRRHPTPQAPPSTLPSGQLAWTATLCPEGTATDDGRIFAPGSITWRELPLTLMAMTKTADGHDGAEVCGRIDRIWRDSEAGLIRASGIFDTSEFGEEIARLVADGTLRGVSVDIAPQQVEIAYRDQVVDENGRWKEPDEAAAEEGEQEDGPSLVDLLMGNSDADVLYVVREAVLGMATVCPFQAFADATIQAESSLVSAVSPMVWTVTGQAGWTLAAKPLTGEATGEPREGVEGPLGQWVTLPGGLTASAAGLAPAVPPADWFADPVLTELTALTVTDDGRVYGHAAPWGLCHIGLPDGCTTAPATQTGYAYFHLKEVECDDGSRVPVGTVTLDTGHAHKNMGRADATRHYDDTGTAVADVVVGEDEWGIWVAGALRGDTDAETARKLRGAALSGDWRSVNGNLELVALLAVNVPGFPIPRPSATLVASGEAFETVTLLAAGVHFGLEGLTDEQRTEWDSIAQAPTEGDWAEIARLVGR